MRYGKTLQLDDDAPAADTIAALKALASTPRWNILQSLASHGMTINELAEALGLPASTTAAHIKILEGAGLIETELRAAAHGLEKVCTRAYDNVLVALPRGAVAVGPDWQHRGRGRDAGRRLHRVRRAADMRAGQSRQPDRFSG